LLLPFAFLCFKNAADAQRPVLQPGTRFEASRVVPQTQHGPASLLARLSQQEPIALSVTAADFYQDSTKTLVTGYALGTGGVISIQGGLKVLPRVEEMATKAPFQPDATYIDVGMRPDFLKSADVNGDGHQDLIVASRGGSSIQVLLGDGHGNFAPLAAIPVDGQITALSLLRSATDQRLIAVGVCDKSCSVDLLQFDGTRVASVPVDDKITILDIARFNGTASEDIIAGGSSGLFVIDGKSAFTATPRLDRLPVSGAISAIDGSFVYDTRGYRQIAVLTGDGSLHTLARPGVLSQPPTPSLGARTLILAHRRPKFTPVDFSNLGWVEVEALNNIAQFNVAGTPTLLWSRVASSGMDNALILKANGGAITTVLHQVVLYPSTGSGERSTMKVLPAKVEVESSSSGQIVGAIALPTAQDSRFGLVMAQSKPTPEYSELTANKTLTINTTADVGSAGVTTSNMNLCINHSAGCTLRAALAVSDADASSNEASGKADTVNVPNGAYVLGDYGPENANSGVVGQPDQYGNTQYHIEIYGPTNLVGTGTVANTTITTNDQDQIFAENSGDQETDSDLSQPPIDFYMSGLTLQHGDLLDATQAQIQANGLQLPFGGLVFADTGQTGYITFVNDVFANGTAPGTTGGALYISDNFNEALNANFGNGVFSASNCIFTNNTAEEQTGGLYVDNYVPTTLSGDTFTHNGNVPLSTDSQAVGQGGAVAINSDEDLSNAPETTITNSTFTNNYGDLGSGANAGSYADGGAIWVNEPIQITNSVFTGNSATNSGGAIFMYAANTNSGPAFTGAITGNIITGNTATRGGGGGIGIDSQGESGSTTGVSVPIQYNSIFGNSAPSNTGTTGLALGYYNTAVTGTTNAAVTASENFWGCNTGANTSGCDGAAVQGGSSHGTLVLTPYAVVTASLSSTSIQANSQITITGYLNSDSASNSIGTLTGFAGLTASINISVGGSSVASSTPNTNSSASAALSASPNTGGSGVATFTVDNATVTKNFTVTLPAPTANPQSVSVAYASSVAVTLSASGSGTITYAVATSPSHGTLSGTAPNLTYHASSGYVGSDSFTFTASNGTTSAPATVTITINQIQPTISLSAPATANRGTASTLAATLTIPSGAPTPSASVSFYAGGTHLIGTTGLTSATATTYTATLHAANLPAGQQTLTASYPGDSNYLTAVSSGQSTLVIANYIWIGNGNGTTSAFDPVGSPYLSSAESEGGAGVAIDNSGNVWSPTSSSNNLAEFSDTGSVISAGYTGGGLSSPTAVAIDGSNRIWVTNANNSISVFDSSGNPISASAYTGTTSGAASPPLNNPTAIAIDGSGNLWIANAGNNTVTEILGAATPTITPLAAGVAGNDPATKP
jgi:hypothetical protein